MKIGVCVRSVNICKVDEKKGVNVRVGMNDRDWLKQYFKLSF
ncbi:MAG: hypothetical protein K0T53_03155 [Wolbachia pipientis]|nr:hypothetical protein [Wolbachia pipientis]